MCLDCHGCPGDIDPMIISTWLSICTRFSNPCLAKCPESEVALLTNQEGEMWPLVSLRVCSMGNSPNLANKT